MLMNGIARQPAFDLHVTVRQQGIPRDLPALLAFAANQISERACIRGLQTRFDGESYARVVQTVLWGLVPAWKQSYRKCLADVDA
jgi:hypothetical protein